MKPVLDENKPVAVGDTGSPLGENGLGRHGSANFHSDSGDESTSMHHVGISLHGDTVSYRGPLLQSISVDLGAGTKHALVHGLASAVPAAVRMLYPAFSQFTCESFGDAGTAITVASCRRMFSPLRVLSRSKAADV